MGGAFVAVVGASGDTDLELWYSLRRTSGCNPEQLDSHEV